MSRYEGENDRRRRASSQQHSPFTDSNLVRFNGGRGSNAQRGEFSPTWNRTDKGGQFKKWRSDHAISTYVRLSRHAIPLTGRSSI